MLRARPFLPVRKNVPARRRNRRAETPALPGTVGSRKDYLIFSISRPVIADRKRSRG
jgi:hypothetical protein